MGKKEGVYGISRPCCARVAGCCCARCHASAVRAALSSTAFPPSSPIRIMRRIGALYAVRAGRRGSVPAARRPPSLFARGVRALPGPRPFFVVVLAALRACAPERVAQAPRCTPRSVCLLLPPLASSLRFHACGHRSPPGTRAAPRAMLSLPVAHLPVPCPPRTFFTCVAMNVASQLVASASVVARAGAGSTRRERSTCSRCRVAHPTRRVVAPTCLRLARSKRRESPCAALRIRWQTLPRTSR